MKGMLVTVFGKTLFRTYNKKYKEGFRDYGIRHHDLSIEIVDTDIQVGYDAKTDEHYIDYSDETLGL